MKFRHFFVLLCASAVVVAFLYVAKPEWFRGVTATVRREPVEMITRKAIVILPVEGRGSPSIADGTDIRQIIDLSDEGLPSRANPYILVVNTGDKTFRHYRLTPNVKAVTPRSPGNDMVVKSLRGPNASGPLQLEIWIPYEREISLDVEYAAPRR